MLGWASSQFEKLSQTVAPPPIDANGRFVYAVQRGDEDGAMACVPEMDAARAVLNPIKKSYAIHLACERSMDRLIRMLLTYPGVDLTFIDNHGNTPLHYAAMSTDKNRGLPTVKMLVTEYKGSVVTKNSSGQTPYDLATLDMVRQFLLPLQLQEETRQAIDNGGVGLPPGIDMGGLRISSPAAPPPPTMPIAPAPMSSPAPHVYSTPQHDSSKPPSSDGGGLGYARTGGSSAAIYKPDGARYVKADGFHSSSSDVNLQRKYGHVPVSYGNIAPPPSSHNGAGTAFPPPVSGGANPYAGGNNPYSTGRARQRYVAYDAVTGQTSSIPRSVPPTYGQTAQNAASPLKYVVFQGGAAPSPAPAANSHFPASGTHTAHIAIPASHPCNSPGPHQTPAATYQSHSYTYGQQCLQRVQNEQGASSGASSTPGYQQPRIVPHAPPHVMQGGTPKVSPPPTLHSGTAGQLQSDPGQVQPAASHTGAIGQFEPSVPSQALPSPASISGAKRHFWPPMVAPLEATGNAPGGFSPMGGGPNAAADLFSSPVPGGPSQEHTAVSPVQQASFNNDKSDQAPAQTSSPSNSRAGSLPNQAVAHLAPQNTPTESRSAAFCSSGQQSFASAGRVVGVAPSVEATASFSNARTAQAEVPQSCGTKASVVRMSPAAASALSASPRGKAAGGDGASAKFIGDPLDAAVPENSLPDADSALVLAEIMSASSTPCASDVFDAPPGSQATLAACSNDGSIRSTPATATGVFGAGRVGQANSVQELAQDAANVFIHAVPLSLTAEGSTQPGATSVVVAPPGNLANQPKAVGAAHLGVEGATLSLATGASQAASIVSHAIPGSQGSQEFAVGHGTLDSAALGALPDSQGKPTQAPTNRAGTTPQPAADVFCGSPPGSIHPAPVASIQPVAGVFSSLQGSQPVAPPGGASLPSAPTSGVFPLVDQAANSAAASNLFASPSCQRVDTSGTQATPAVNCMVQRIQPSLAAMTPGTEASAALARAEEQEPSIQKAERPCSPSGSDEVMADVPLSPEVQSQAGDSIPQDTKHMVDGAAFCPLPVTGQMQTRQSPTATSVGESLFAAIGMPPPPFSSKR